MSKIIVTSAFGLVAASFSIAHAENNDFYFTPKLFYGWSTLDNPQKEALAQHYQVGKMQPDIRNFSLGFDLGYKINPYVSIEVDILEFSAHNTPPETTKINQMHKQFAELVAAEASIDELQERSESGDSGDLFEIIDDVVTPPPTTGVTSNGDGGVVSSEDSDTSSGSSGSNESHDSGHGEILNNTDTFTLSRTVLWFSCKTQLYRVNPELHAWAKAGFALVSFHAHATDSKTIQSADIEKKNSMSLIPALGIGISYQFTPSVGFDLSGNYIFGIKNAALEYPGIGFVSAGVRFSFE